MKALLASLVILISFGAQAQSLSGAKLVQHKPSKAIPIEFTGKKKAVETKKKGTKAIPIEFAGKKKAMKAKKKKVLKRNKKKLKTINRR